MAQDVRIRTSLQGVGDVRAGFKGIGASISGLQQNVFNLKTAVAGLGAAFALKGIINTNKEVQKLQAQLRTFTGSAEAASAKWEELLDFASETPFQIQDVVSSFQRLKAVGIDPTRRELEAFGDIAAGSGRSIIQFAEAVADASTGEFERLKEFGIIARSEADQVSIRFGEFATTVQKDSASIMAALSEIGQNEFGGAMEEQMNTLEGAFSQLGQAATEMAIQIGEGGLNDAVIDTANSFTDLINGNDELARKMGAFTGDIVRLAVPAFQALANNIDLVVAGFAGLAAFKFLAVFNPLIGVLGAAAGALTVLATGLGDVEAQFGRLREQAIDSAEEIGGLEGRFEEVTGQIGSTSGEIEGLRRHLEDLRAEMGEVDATSGKIGTGLEDALRDPTTGTEIARTVAMINALTEQLANLQLEAEKLEVQLRRQKDTQKDVTGAVNEGAQASGEATDKISDEEKARQKIIATLEKEREARRFNALEAEHNALAEAFQGETRREEYERELEAFQAKERAKAEAMEALETIRREGALQREKDRIDEEQREIEQNERTIERLTDTQFNGLAVATSLHNAFQGFFKGMLTGAETLGEGLKGLFASIADSILAEFARIAASFVFQVLFGGGGGEQRGNQFGSAGASLLSGGTGLLGSVLGGLGGGGLFDLLGLGTGGLSGLPIPFGFPDVFSGIFDNIFGGLFDGIGGIFGSIFGGIGSFFGGLFQRGGSFVADKPTFIGVGEAGAERVEITPLARGGSRGGVTIVLQGPTIFDEITMQQFVNHVSDALTGAGAGSITRAA